MQVRTTQATRCVVLHATPYVVEQAVYEYQGKTVSGLWYQFTKFLSQTINADHGTSS